MGLFKLVGQLMAGDDGDLSDYWNDQAAPAVRPAPPVMPPSPTSQPYRFLVLHTYFGETETMH